MENKKGEVVKFNNGKAPLIVSILLMSLTFTHFNTIQAKAKESRTHYQMAKQVAEKCKHQYTESGQQDPSDNLDEDENQYITNNSKLVNCLTTNARSSLLSHAKYNLNISLKDVDRENEHTNFLEFDAVVPIWKKANQAMFLQPGFITSIKADTRKQNGVSLGVVYHFVVNDGVIGLNVFYDYNKVRDMSSGGDYKYVKRDFDVQRTGLGFDYQSGKNKLAFNYYLPSSEWSELQIADDLYRDSGAQGYDLSFAREFSKRLSAFFKYSYTKYTKFHIKYPSEVYAEGEDKEKYTGGVDYRLTCDMSLSGYAEKDPSRDDVELGIGMSFSFGRSSFNDDQCFSETSN